MKHARRAGFEPLGFILQRESDLRVPPSIETAPIAFRDWEAAVGTRIAARARPVRLDRGLLIVRTATATWAQELSLLSEDILRELRARGIEVSALRFRVGRVDAPERPPSRDEVRSSPPEVPLPRSLERAVERVSDPELREAITRAAAKNLGWQQMRKTEPEPRGPGPARTDGTRALALDKAATSARAAARGPRSVESESAEPDGPTRPTSGGRRGTT